jgi:hypothetical protein
MARTLLNLANSLEKRAADLPKKVSGVAVSTALAIVNDLANVTPVDTSQAISNWQVSLGSKIDSKIKPHYPGEKGSTKTPSGNVTRENARNVLQSKAPGVTIYISNSLPYIRRLNDGYSNQAPAGFVERAVLIARKQVKRKKIKF